MQSHDHQENCLEADDTISDVDDDHQAHLWDADTCNLSKALVIWDHHDHEYCFTRQPKGFVDQGKPEKEWKSSFRECEFGSFQEDEDGKKTSMSICDPLFPSAFMYIFTRFLYRKLVAT
jgi:hypothetical protein